MQFLKFSLLRKRIKGVIPMIKDSEVSFGKKLLLFFGIVYLFLPVDLIPPLVPVFGWFDDIVIWLFIIYYLKDELDAHVPEEEEGSGVKRKRGGFRGKDVYDVEYSVKEEPCEASEGISAEDCQASEGSDDAYSEPSENGASAEEQNPKGADAAG